MPLKATWRQIPTNVRLSRSSHSLSIVKGRGYIFGGEEKPREPVENHVHVFTLPLSEHDIVDYRIVRAASAHSSDVPVGGIGHTATTIDDRIYAFRGGGGKDMQALEENGRVWVFDTKLNLWNFIDPMKGSPFPVARSYYSSTSTSHSASVGKDQTEDPLGGIASGFDDHGTIFIHGGCPASGRTADLLGFDVAARVR